MAFTTNPYCLLADVHLVLGTVSTADDTWLTALIPQAQAMIDRYIGYSFQTDGSLSVPATRLYNGNDNNQLYIDDCISISQVLENTYNLFVGSNGQWNLQNVQSMDITVDVILEPYNQSPQYLMSRISGLPFYRGKQNYKVFGVFGEPSIPADIAYACARLVAHLRKKREAQYSTQIQEMGGVKTIYSMGIPKDIIDLLETHKRRLFLTGGGYWGGSNF